MQLLLDGFKLSLHLFHDEFLLFRLRNDLHGNSLLLLGCSLWCHCVLVLPRSPDWKLWLFHFYLELMAF